MENEKNQEKRHHSSHHHHDRHRSSSSRSSQSGEKRRSSTGNDSQKKVVNDRMKEVRWEKVFKPIVEGLMVVGFIILIVLIIWFLLNPEKGTRKTNNITPEIVAEKQEEIKNELAAKEEQKEIDDVLERIKELEKRVEDLEDQLR